MEKQRLKKYLSVGLISLLLTSSLSAAGIGKVYIPALSPEQKTQEWRHQVISLLKEISGSSQKSAKALKKLSEEGAFAKEAETPHSSN